MTSLFSLLHSTINYDVNRLLNVWLRISDSLWFGSWITHNAQLTYLKRQTFYCFKLQPITAKRGNEACRKTVRWHCIAGAFWFACLKQKKLRTTKATVISCLLLQTAIKMNNLLSCFFLHPCPELYGANIVSVTIRFQGQLGSTLFQCLQVCSINEGK